MLEQFRRSFLTTQVFVQRAYCAYESMDGDQFRMRSFGGAKELIEEILPLTSLLKHLELPGRRIRCRFVGGDQNHDAQIRVSGVEVKQGFLEAHYFVEVTTAVSPHDYLIREALTRYGSAFAGSKIRRVGSQRQGNDRIISEPEAVDVGKTLDDSVAWVSDRLKKKALKDYPSPCILVVNVEPDGRLSMDDWLKLRERVQANVDRERFKATYIVHCLTNTVLRI